MAATPNLSLTYLEVGQSAKETIFNQNMDILDTAIGVLPIDVSQGGTGLTSLTDGGLLVGNGTSPLTVLSVGGSGRVLTGVTGADPAFSATPTLGIAGSLLGTLALAGNTSGTITIQPQAAAGTYNFNLPTSAGSAGQPLLSGGGGGAAQTYGTLGVAGGGTGLATLTVHALYVGNGTSAPTALSVGATGSVLAGNTGADPAFTATPTITTLTLTNPLGVASGGTGLATQTIHALYVGNGTSAPTALAVGATGTVLAGSTGADPAFTATPTVTSLTLSGASGNTLVVDTSTLIVDATNHRVGILTTSPTNTLSFDGQATRTLWMERHTTSNTAGSSLIVQAGGATSGATDKAGGILVLRPGVSTGTGSSEIRLQTHTPALTTGTADNAVVARLTIAGPGTATFALSPGTGTLLPGLTLTEAAHTALTASTERFDVRFNLARTVEWATGALTTQRFAVFQAPTIGFVGASTVTDTATVAISGAPVKGTNATLSNTHALLIQAGAVSTAAVAFGLTVNTPTGASANYAAQFLGGNVGIGTSAPGALLDLGLAGTTLGVMRLAGSTSGNVTVQPAATAGTWTLTLPTSGGTSGYVLTTNGSGVSTWTAGATAAGAGLPFTVVSGTSQSMAVNNGYIANNAALVTCTLPASAAVGDLIEVLGLGAGGWRVGQNSGQTIHNGVTGTATTTGTGGYIDSTSQYATIRLRCIVATTDWTIA